MTTKRNRRKRRTATPTETQRPRVLVLEGLTGASRVVRYAGGEPITVNPRDIAAVDAALKQPFDALLLTGGGDVDPRLYGDKPHKRVYGVNETRDMTEWIALGIAKERNVPVLGICRGSQIMAVHNGGRLKQHVRGHRNTEHLVFAENRSLFKRTVGNAMGCVSLHHQVVLTHGRGFRVAARNREGMIEAIESRDGRCLGVQFHPEMDYFTNVGSRLILRWLIEEAAARAGVQAPPQMKLPKRTTAVTTASKKPGKNRSAGTRRYPVKTSWVCPVCAMRFDNLKDREDHIWVLHDQKPLFESLGTPPRWDALGPEPPTDHPDWEVQS